MEPIDQLTQCRTMRTLSVLVVLLIRYTNIYIFIYLICHISFGKISANLRYKDR